MCTQLHRELSEAFTWTLLYSLETRNNLYPLLGKWLHSPLQGIHAAVSKSKVDLYLSFSKSMQFSEEMDSI